MPLAESRRIDIGMATGADAHVLGDADELRILIKNLVDNAIRYTPAGGRVDLSAWSDASGVTIGIGDTGPGIPPAQRTRVFDPFFRLMGSEQAGSGLGLAIVAEIAARAGATLRLEWTEPAAQRGLLVTVHFPPSSMRIASASP